MNKTVLQLTFGPYSALNPNAVSPTFLFEVFGIKEVDDEYFMTISDDTIQVWTEFLNKNEISVRVLTIHESN